MTKDKVDQELLDESVSRLFKSTKNTYRDLVIADRLEQLFHDSLDDGIDIWAGSLTRLVDALVDHQEMSKPSTITLTPDGTIMVRWQGLPEGFVRTSIEFPSGKAVTICHGVRAEWDFYKEYDR